MGAPFDQSRIAAAVGFGPDELTLNRAGRVSDRQRSQLQRTRRSGQIGLVVMGLLGVAFIVIVAVVILPKVNANRHGSAKVPIAPVTAACAGVMLIFFLSIWRTQRRLRRLASGAVHEVVGVARTRAHRMPGNVEDMSSGGVRYELRVGETMFFVAGPAVLDAFADGATYRAFYAAGGTRVLNTLLSAERLG